jgi:hypothetical protein
LPTILTVTAEPAIKAMTGAPIGTRRLAATSGPAVPPAARPALPIAVAPMSVTRPLGRCGARDRFLCEGRITIVLGASEEGSHCRSDHKDRGADRERNGVSRRASGC